MNDKNCNINLLLTDFNDTVETNTVGSCLRESFDRYCDDLCTVIIDYLTFEDKIRLECVSKQWKRCIFRRQTVLELNAGNRPFRRKNILNQLLKSCDNSALSKQVNCVAFESVLRKCEFISKIVFDKTIKTNENHLHLISRYCPHLKEFAFDFDKINEKSLIDFGLKCGQSLHSIEFHGIQFNKNYKTLLKLCPNLLAINGLRVNDIINGSDCLVPKLSRVNQLFESNETQLMQVFVHRYRKTLRSFGTNPNSDIDEDRQNCLMQQISRLVNLEELILECYFFEGFSPLFADNLKLIAFNCPKIERLNIDTHDVCPELALQIFDSMSYFPSLKSLTLHLPKPLFGSYDSEEISVASLSECKQLTYLALTHPEITDNFFVDVDVHSSQLTHLDVMIDKEISDNCLNWLAKLKKLKRVTFRRPRNVDKFAFVTDAGLCNVINNCPAIKSMRFTSRPNMTYKTIEALIAQAWKKPRITYHHYFGSMGKKIDPSFALIDMNYYTCVPNNLKVIVSNSIANDNEF